MQKSSWFLKASATGTLALIMSAAALGGGYSADAFATAAATTAATAAAAPSLPVCYMAANITKVRVVHASPSSPSVDIYVDGAKTPAIKALAYDKATDYVELSQGTHQITVTKAGDAKTVVFDQPVAIKGLNAYTLVAEGTIADKTITVKPYLDDASDTAGKVRVVVIHAIPDGPAVDVLVNGTPVIQGLASGASQELNIDAPAKPVDIEVTAAGNAKSVILSLKNTTLTADTIYTVLATGLVGSKTEKAVALKPVVLTSASFANFPAPATPTPAPTAAATMAATAAPAAATMAATVAATAAPVVAATPVATAAATVAAATNVPKGTKPASAGLAVRTSRTYKLLNGPKCVQVAGVTVVGGPADVAGLTANDLILAVDGTPLANIATFSAIVLKHASGDTLTLTIQDTTTGKESNVPLILGANPFLG
jgi:Domain of unknown function (DUF4397)/PDZ domain